MNTLSAQAAKVFLIEPVHQSISQLHSANIPSLVSETVGEDAECYKLDSADNVVWMTLTKTNNRYAYFFEGMPYPFEEKHYSKALVVSLGPHYWDVDTILDYLRWYDQRNLWGD
jgi:hypothetical protein